MKTKKKPEDYSFSCETRVRYAEVDAQGIVFNAHYLTYFDIGITEFFRSQGSTYQEYVQDTGLDFHVVRAELDYKSPARFDQVLAICVTGSYRGAKIFWDIAIFEKERLVCSGILVYAAVKMQTGRPVKITEDKIPFLEKAVMTEAELTILLAYNKSPYESPDPIFPFCHHYHLLSTSIGRL